MHFPLNLSEDYFFSINFVTYSRPDPYTNTINLTKSASGILGGAAPGSGSINLPVPARMIDSQNLKWVQQENVGGLLGAGADAFDGDKDIGSQVANQLARVTSAVSSSLAGIGGGATGDLAAYLLQKSGLALNPVLTQMFKHPEFKVHQFSWKLAPSHASESNILQSAIDTIKYNALPDITQGGAFFNYPSIALIKIKTGANGELYYFQPAVITNVTVNWAPSGVPSFFAGSNAPTIVQLDISFVEIILNTRSNFQKGSVAGDVAGSFNFENSGPGAGTSSSGFNFSLGTAVQSATDKVNSELINQLKG